MSQFQQVHNRLHTRSMKWDNRKAIFQNEEVLPMWVADMDFKAPSEVNNALRERVDHGIYGYTLITEDIKENVQAWIKNRHRWEIDTNWLSFSPGVITTLHIAIQELTEENDRILIQTPVYTPFFNLIKKGKRQIVESPLHYDGQTYTIDFDAFEEQLQTVKAFIFCSPHNPVGRVWTREELEKIASLCKKHNVIVFSDEIHADLTFEQNHIPFASISEDASKRTITCMSPTKTFNLAGLQASYLVTENKSYKQVIDDALSLQGFNMLNTMGMTALDAAYQYGKSWLDQLLKVIEGNKIYVETRLANETNGKLKVINSEGTYLLWVDCKDLGLTDKELQQFMIHEAKVGLNAGSSYGKEGENFMRINIACPKETLKEGIDRIIHAVQNMN